MLRAGAENLPLNTLQTGDSVSLKMEAGGAE